MSALRAKFHRKCCICLLLWMGKNCVTVSEGMYDVFVAIQFAEALIEHGPMI